jgi:hypothetical protein
VGILRYITQKSAAFNSPIRIIGPHCMTPYYFPGRVQATLFRCFNVLNLKWLLAS